jgi:hypothetical protein
VFFFQVSHPVRTINKLLSAVISDIKDISVEYTHLLITHDVGTAKDLIFTNANVADSKKIYVANLRHAACLSIALGMNEKLLCKKLITCSDVVVPNSTFI